MKDIILANDIVLTVAQQITAKRMSALFKAVQRAVNEVTGSVQCLIGKVDGRLCVKVTDIRNDAQRDAIKDVLDTQFCESLMPVKATKTTLVYALPVVKGV